MKNAKDAVADALTPLVGVFLKTPRGILLFQFGYNRLDPRMGWFRRSKVTATYCILKFYIAKKPLIWYCYLNITDSQHFYIFLFVILRSLCFYFFRFNSSMQKVFMGKSKNVANGNAAGSSELEDGNTYYDYIWDDNPSWPLLAAGKVNQTGWAPKIVLTNIITC